MNQVKKYNDCVTVDTPAGSCPILHNITFWIHKLRTLLKTLHFQQLQMTRTVTFTNKTNPQPHPQYLLVENDITQDSKYPLKFLATTRASHSRNPNHQSPQNNRTTLHKWTHISTNPRNAQILNYSTPGPSSNFPTHNQPNPLGLSKLSSPYTADTSRQPLHSRTGARRAAHRSIIIPLNASG